MSIHLLSLPVALIYFYTMWRADGLASALTICVPLSGLIAALFYADEIGGYTGWIGGRSPITQTTPGFIIRLFVWILLITPLVILTFQKI